MAHGVPGDLLEQRVQLCLVRVTHVFENIEFQARCKCDLLDLMTGEDVESVSAGGDTLSGGERWLQIAARVANAVKQRAVRRKVSLMR